MYDLLFTNATLAAMTGPETKAAAYGLVENADIMIYASSFTDEEYKNFVGWGHSTWQEAIRVGEAAKVKQVVIFHHDPSHTDSMMDEIAAAAEAMRPGTVVAREGMVLEP